MPARAVDIAINVNIVIFLLSFVCFDLLCLCMYQMWERSRYVPAVAAAQIPSTTITPIVFSSFIIDRYG